MRGAATVLPSPRLRIVDPAAPLGSVPTEMDPRSSGFTGSGQDLFVWSGAPEIFRVRVYDSSHPPSPMLTMKLLVRWYVLIFFLLP